MITLKDIATRCGVSIATVSNILNGKTNVSEATKKKILEVVKETGYTPNIMAQGLRSQRTRTIGVIVEDINLFSSPGLIDGILLSCEMHKYRAIISNLRMYSENDALGIRDAEEYHKVMNPVVQKMLAIKVDGIIYVSGHYRVIDCFPEGFPVPAVYAYGRSLTERYSSVFIDDEKSAYDIISYLIKKGHKKIGIICGCMDNNHTMERLEGIKQAFFENNLPFNEELVLEGNWQRESGYKMCKTLYENKSQNDFTAIFCMNDLMAAGVYDYCLEKGIVPGKDISVAGFDDHIISRFLNPPLTTMAIALRGIGFRATDLLLSKVENPMFMPIVSKIPCEFQERKSVVDISGN